MKAIVITALFITITAHARVNWTPQQMEQKYGKPTGTIKIADLEFQIYTQTVDKKTYTIKAHYSKYAKVDMIHYKPDKGFLSPAEVHGILKNHQTGFTGDWEKQFTGISTTGEWKNKRYHARVKVFEGLVITTTATWDQYHAALKSDQEATKIDTSEAF